ncbi:hypothetical protein Q31b_57270 [Novipirellula aureliae]|uniref:Uncharacterized protein n=1 Tax=Novipirellula aureliae TaxID=2527966 RepID=A0A5C6D9W7_9BACT|nr:hypothetical protein [Novipirellula aureliae]TWU33670.1 hypothetical protein Q31b_57270 [Novipirellula aureliae]
MVRLARREVLDPQEVAIALLYNRTCGRCFLLGGMTKRLAKTSITGKFGSKST